MSKLRSTLLIFALTALPLFAEALKTGSQIKQLPVSTALDGSKRQLSEFLGKKFVVLYIWEMNQAALSEFFPLSRSLPELRKAADFIGIGIGTADELKRFPGADKLGFPILADTRKAAVKLFARRGENLPLCVLLDKNGTLLWRGNSRLLPKVLKECTGGRFNLAAEIRVEEFSNAVSTAVRQGEFEKALQLVSGEYANYPDRINLLKAQIALLKKLKRTQEIFPLLHAAQRRQPGNFRIYELEYMLIGETAAPEKLPDFIIRLKNDFAGKPEILMAFALAECKLPPERINLHVVMDLAATGWKSQAFSKKLNRGLYALDYASILHSAGRNDLAAILAKEACEDLKEDKKHHPKALQAFTYYTKIAGIAPTLKLPDLKK